MNFFYKLQIYTNLLKESIKYFLNKGKKNKYNLFLEKYFKKNNSGLYIDVGCYHPFRLSNTKFLYDKGWKGINIDISRKSIDLFNIIRKNDINLNIGIGAKNHKVFGYFQKKLYFSNTLSKDHSKTFLSNPIKKKIKIYTLSFIINRYFKNKNIDFLDIYCEGKDLEVLKGLNFKKNKFNLISIEVHSYDKKTKKNSAEIHRIMKKNDFKLVFGKSESTKIFKNKFFN